MPAISDLQQMLAGMEPVLWPEPYGFAVTDRAVAGVFATVAEDEGRTVIAPIVALEAAGVMPGPAFARISLTVHSALDAVGLTAAFARALADKGISANVIAGYHHDHIFLPWAMRQAALAALRELAHA